MNQAECDYWNKIAQERTQDRLRDNIWKRQQIMARLMQDNWIDERVLEIGIGSATAAAAIQLVILRQWKYLGTDVSKIFCEAARQTFHLNTMHTDILNLPGIDYGFTRVMALDTLEHVRPNDRAEGYERLSSVMAKHCRMYVHWSRGESKHDPNFDHPFDMLHVEQLAKITGTRIVKAEEYQCTLPSVVIPYVWVVMDR